MMTREIAFQKTLPHAGPVTAPRLPNLKQTADFGKVLHEKIDDPVAQIEAACDQDEQGSSRVTEQTDLDANTVGTSENILPSNLPDVQITNLTKWLIEAGGLLAQNPPTNVLMHPLRHVPPKTDTLLELRADVPKHDAALVVETAHEIESYEPSVVPTLPGSVSKRSYTHHSATSNPRAAEDINDEKARSIAASITLLQRPDKGRSNSGDRHDTRQGGADLDAHAGAPGDTELPIASAGQVAKGPLQEIVASPAQQLVDHLTKAVREIGNAGPGPEHQLQMTKLRIVLEPVSLGKVLVSLTHSVEGLHVQISVGEQVTLELLQRDKDQLEGLLRAVAGEGQIATVTVSDAAPDDRSDTQGRGPMEQNGSFHEFPSQPSPRRHQATQDDNLSTTKADAIDPTYSDAAAVSVREMSSPRRDIRGGLVV